MEIRVLNYFLAVAREKNISRAAKKLHLTQPTLSKQLKDLEEELGVTLFERGPREIQLTPSGQYLFSKAKEILSLVEKTTSNLVQNEIVSGEIYIGAGETPVMSLITDTLNQLIDVYPLLKFHLYSGDADDVMAKLDSGLLDFGLVIGPVNKQRYHFFRLDAQDQWGVLLHRAHPLAKQQNVRPSDLKDIPLLLSRQASADTQLSEWFGFNLEQLEIIGTYNLLYNASLMVRSHHFGVLCLAGIINTHGTEQRFLPLEPPLTASLNLIWKKDEPLSLAAKKFLALLMDKEK